MGEYRTSLLENANNPGYLDIGAGGTWTPTSSLLVNFHPLNYNIIFADDELGFTSSMGLKILADFKSTLWQKVDLGSTLSAFVSYKASELSNYTWTNRLNLKLFGGLGLGLEYALRVSEQETREFEDDLQSYFILGLSYTL